MAKEKACRKCRSLTTGKVCPVCKSSDLSPDWQGLILVFDPQKSLVANTLEIAAPSRYALKVS